MKCPECNTHRDIQYNYHNGKWQCLTCGYSLKGTEKYIGTCMVCTEPVRINAKGMAVPTCKCNWDLDYMLVRIFNGNYIIEMSKEKMPDVMIQKKLSRYDLARASK
jgi:hypothetical protein